MPNSYDEGVIKPHSIYIAYRRDIKQWLVGVICGAKKAEFETSRLSFPHLEIPNVTRSTLLVLKSLQRSYGGRLPLRHTSRSRGPWIARKQILDCKVTLACVVPHTHMAKWRILPGALAKRFVLDFFFCSEVFEYTYVKWQRAFFFIIDCSGDLSLLVILVALPRACSIAHYEPWENEFPSLCCCICC